jgi:hypothetical protein
VFPDNWEAFSVFASLETQWAKNAKGEREGIRYEAMQATLVMTGAKRATWPRLFADVRVMERAALDVWRR